MKLGVLLLGLAACRPVLAPRQAPPDEDPSAAYDALLGRVVTEAGWVDYDRLEADRGALDAYVAWIAKPRPNLPRDNPRHAFMINAYNALVLYAVLEDGRPASVLDVQGWLPTPGSGFFYERAFLVDGVPTSLWEIEHEFLRGKVMDHRDHAALNCASASCPPLRAGLYGGGLNATLDAAMTRWIDDEVRGVRIEPGRAVFSPIFDWFAWDFSFFTSGDDLCTMAARHASPAKAKALRELADKGCPHSFFDYDWSLNDASGQGRDPDQVVPAPLHTDE